MATHTAAQVRMNRWVILAGYALLTACTQLLWLAYAPITTQTHQAMGVSSGAVGDLAIIFPLMYVILALPAGRWLDTRFGQALGLGAILTAGGGLLRLAGPSSVTLNTTCPSSSARLTRTADPGACLAAFCSASMQQK